MVVGRVRLFAVIVAALAVLSTASSLGAVSQPSYDTIRIEEDGAGIPYQVWVEWTPLIVTLPDGGAWAFFSAEVVRGEELGTKKLYAARFDPAAGVWQPATAMPGGEIQFGPSAAVGGDGTVHLIYSDRASDDPGDFSSLVYTKTTPEGTWTEPIQVAANENAGHQLSPSLAIDGNGAMHVLWQDQRGVTAEMREASPSNADVLGCTLAEDGACASPVTVSVRPSPETNASRPQLEVDGNRLVAVWSTYVGTTTEELSTAQLVEWSQITLGEEGATWAAPATLIERDNGLIGGKLVDVDADPTGGVVVVFGRRTDTNVLHLTRLAADSAEWSEPLPVVSGDRGSFPSVAIGPDGTAYVAFNAGSGMTVRVGAIALGAGQPLASEVTIISEAEEGAQGRPVVDVDANGKVWVLYLREPSGGVANEVRALRGALISAEPAAAAPATPVPGTPVATPAATPEP
ncbi:MAG: hypothetical protein ACRDJH_18775 [Thermomicrobiales bacterium]